jgi:hypothetical protein
MRRAISNALGRHGRRASQPTRRFVAMKASANNDN